MPADMQLLMEKLREMKDMYENAIKNGEYTSLIRSKKLINILHEYVIEELKRRIEQSWIVTDKKIYGFPKVKEQDIVIKPPEDDANNVSVGPLMVINVRSQLSSIEKNYDTMFERLFAEALNIHNRFPYTVLGYIYLLPKVGYDPEAAKERRVELSERYNLEKYIFSFSSVANRRNPHDAPWRYERMCLLIVDFEKETPEVMESMSTFLNEGIVSEQFARFYTFKHLSIRGFFDDLHKLMVERYYLLFSRSQR